MFGIVCRICGGDMDEILHGDGIQCDTCGFIVRSDGKTAQDGGGSNPSVLF